MIALKIKYLAALNCLGLQDSVMNHSNTSIVDLKGTKIYLRALEPEDLDLVFRIENNLDFWEVSANSAPYSRYLIKQYLENAHRDIYEVKQLRLVICDSTDQAIGLIDLFDFDPKNRRAAVGIVIEEESARNKGYGKQALELLSNYSFTHLALHQIYAHVGADNTASRKLFESLGYRQAGRKKDWNFVNGSFKDELLYQLINHVH